MRRTKVIHVYLVFEKRNYYFSSVTGIFRHLSEDQKELSKVHYLIIWKALSSQVGL